MERSKSVQDMDIKSPEFLQTLSDLTERVVAYRAENGGNLPKEVWLKLLEASGSYLCAELLIVSPEGDPVLKLREDSTAQGGETAWEGKLHIPGIAVGNRKAHDILPVLIKKEISDNDGDVPNLQSKTRLAGFFKYPEPERKTVADTLMFVIQMGVEDMKLLQNDFFVVTDQNIGQVIDQHRPTIEWYRNGMPDFMVDTRKV